MKDGSQKLPPLRLGPSDVEDYLVMLKNSGRRSSTVTGYAPKLAAFVVHLPDGVVSDGTLLEWRGELLSRGHSPATANAYLSAANGLMAFLGRRDLQLTSLPDACHSLRPELTRAEYLSVLASARTLGRRRDYLLVKSMVVLGLSASALGKLAVEALSEGLVGEIAVPEFLSDELGSFAAAGGIAAGPVFCGRDGRALSRSAVASSLRSLATSSGISPEKLSPGALSSLRRETLRQIENDLAPLAEHAYGHLLSTEQMAVGWEG